MAITAVIFILVSSATFVDSFTASSVGIYRGSSPTTLLLPRKMSEPSDTSSTEDFTNDDYPGYAAKPSTERSASVAVVEDETINSKNNAMVSNVLDLLNPINSIGVGTNNEVRAAINEALYQLEAVNPVRVNPALSPLLNGVWELRYFGGYSPEGALKSPTRQIALFLYSGGYSPGLFALQLASQLGVIRSDSKILSVGDLEISISRSQPRVEATIPVQLLTGASSIKVAANLEASSGMRLRETYASVNFLGTTNLQLPSFLRYSREIYITYVDEDLLVLRDASGIPEVLVRKEKTFVSSAWGTDPISDDDRSPPGVTITSDNDDDDDGNAPSY